MTEEKMSPLRARMIEDMRIRGMSPKTQQGHIRAVRYFAEFIGRSPDTATPDELRAYQLHMTDSGVSTGVFNARIVSLRFFFGLTCGREEMKRYMQFRRKAKKLPVVLSVEEVGDLLAAVPGPGLKYRAALGISYGAGLRASEVCNLKVSDIDSDRMLIHVDEGKNDKDRKAMLSPALGLVFCSFVLRGRVPMSRTPKRRTPQHLVDERGIALLKRKIPENWVLREYRPDYGLDFPVVTCH